MAIKLEEFEMSSGRYGIVCKELVGFGGAKSVLEIALDIDAQEIENQVILTNGHIEHGHVYLWNKIKDVRNFKNFFNKKLRSERVTETKFLNKI